MTIPTLSNRFVGRDDDVSELTELLTASRLVTLCGTGGIGKTRLALRVAENSLDTFGDGVWTVELADLVDENTLLERLVSVLCLDVRGGAFETVVGALSTGRQLLLLDNCEHLVEACAVLCDRLLSACRDLTILTTSREPLRAAGECVWRVPPMALVRGPEGPSDAELLFTERALAAVPGMEWTESEDRTIGTLCGALEGIPLAIELAAAMTRVLTVDEIRDRLSDRFRLLTTGPRTAPARQRTLWATVEWSHQTLSEDAKSLLRQLTVFRGGWTLGMAEEVCLEVDDLLGATTELVDKSLIIVDGQPGGQIRYRMLDTIREFAGGLLAQEEAETLAHRHLDCVAAMTKLGREMGALQVPGIQRHSVTIEGVLPNVFTALSFAERNGRADVGVLILTDLQFIILGLGRFEEYMTSLDRLLDHELPDWLRGRGLAMRSLICLYCADFAGGYAACAEAIALSREPEGRRGLILATALAQVLGVPDGPSPEEAIALSRAGGDLDLELIFGLMRSQAAQFGGKLREAREHYEETATMLAPDNYWGLAVIMLGLAEVAEARGDLPAALDHYEEARRQLFDTPYATDTRGENIRCLLGLGRVALRSGDLVNAAALLRQGVELCRGLGLRVYAWELVAALALLASREGEHARAVLLAGAADGLRPREAEEAGARAADILDPAAKELGPHEAARLWSEGREMSWKRVVEHALSGVLPSGEQVLLVRPASNLTDRQLEIARQVARGLSNRQISDQLVISQATVARHVSNILTKLGFSSRAQIASWITEHRA